MGGKSCEKRSQKTGGGGEVSKRDERAGSKMKLLSLLIKRGNLH